MNRLLLSLALLVSVPLLAMQRDEIYKKDGDTNLISAVRKNSIEAVREALWELHSKDFYESRRQVEESNKQGVTALHVAAWLGNKEICLLLLEQGAIPTTRTAQLKNAFDHAYHQRDIIKLFEKWKGCQNSAENIGRKLRQDEQTEPLALTFP